MSAHGLIVADGDKAVWLSVVEPVETPHTLRDTPDLDRLDHRDMASDLRVCTPAKDGPKNF
jgi:hypothetical protein